MQHNNTLPGCFLVDHSPFRHASMAPSIQCSVPAYIAALSPGNAGKHLHVMKGKHHVNWPWMETSIQAAQQENSKWKRPEYDSLQRIQPMSKHLASQSQLYFATKKRKERSLVEPQMNKGSMPDAAGSTLNTLRWSTEQNSRHKSLKYGKNHLVKYTHTWLVWGKEPEQEAEETSNNRMLQEKDVVAYPGDAEKWQAILNFTCSLNQCFSHVCVSLVKMENEKWGQ